MAVPPAYKRRRISGSHAVGGNTVAASLTTAIAGTNNDLVYTARQRGTGGNSIRVRYVVSGTNTPLSVSVSGGNDVTVNSATDGGGAATSTASQVATAVLASQASNFLVSVSNAAGNDGTGVIAAMGFTSLTLGRDWVTGRG